MVLTFLNLVVIRGILVGLLQGSTDAYVKSFSGDIIISDLPKKNYIENSADIISIVKNLPWLQSYSARYIETGSIEAGYKERINFKDDPNSAGGQIVGIDPVAESRTTNIASYIVEGSYLTPSDTDSVLLGANLLKKYLPIDAPGLSLLENVKVGDKVRINLSSGVLIGAQGGSSVGNADSSNSKEFTVKGILKSKTDIDQRVFMLDQSLRPLIGRGDYNVDEIAIRLKPGSDLKLVKDALIKMGAGKTARVQTWQESLPKFLKDIQDTFGILGNVMGSISLVVASITIFIVIFINAITRRKFIGILKGIGVDPLAIEISYIFQSIFYALLGIFFGMIVLYGFLVPFIAAHPINFPFSDGILVAEVPGTLLRAFFLVLFTIIAGFIPARLVVKKNTLDSILGR
jgi:ABC-type lipoprotein release transport system permease subunit